MILIIFFLLPLLYNLSFSVFLITSFVLTLSYNLSFFLSLCFLLSLSYSLYLTISLSFFLCFSYYLFLTHSILQYIYLSLSLSLSLCCVERSSICNFETLAVKLFSRLIYWISKLCKNFGAAAFGQVLRYELALNIQFPTYK